MPEDAMRALVRMHVAGKHDVRAELEQHRLHRSRHVIHLMLVLLVAVVPARASAACQTMTAPSLQALSSIAVAVCFFSISPLLGCFAAGVRTRASAAPRQAAVTQ